MSEFLILILFLLFLVFIVGMIKPGLFYFLGKKINRKKIIIYFLIAMFINVISIGVAVSLENIDSFTDGEISVPEEVKNEQTTDVEDNDIDSERVLPQITTDEKNDVIIEEVSSEKKDSQAVIPGLTSADIKVNLENKGFECTGPERGEDGLVDWKCSSKDSLYERWVEYVGYSPMKIIYVSATAMSFEKEFSDANRQFLSYIASLPFEGNNQEISKKWVLNSVENNEMMSGEIRHRLFFSGKSGILTIAHPAANLD